MRDMEIRYDHLRHIDASYGEKLAAKERIIRAALEKVGPFTRAEWRSIDDGDGHQMFRLLVARSADAQLDECVVQLSPLDLTLGDHDFEQLLSEAKRPYIPV